MNKDILMTIGIPTYNGVKYLTLAIESIIREIPADKQNCYEILISDNASTDNTKEVVLNFQKQYPQLIRYIFNKTNLGFDRNLDILIRSSKGKFVKLLGDDDELLPNSINQLTKIILDHADLKVIVHSVEFFDIVTNQIFESDHNIHETKIYTSGDEFFQESRWATMAFAGLLINRESWLKANLKKYIGSKWMHIGGLIEILKLKNQKSFGFSDKLVLVRLNNERWREENFKTDFQACVNHSKVFDNLLFNGYKLKTYYRFILDRFRIPVEDVVKLRSRSFLENLRMSFVMIRFYWFVPKYLIVNNLILVFGKSFFLSIVKIIKRICEKKM